MVMKFQCNFFGVYISSGLNYRVCHFRPQHPRMTQLFLMVPVTRKPLRKDVNRYCCFLLKHCGASFFLHKMGDRLTNG